MSRPLCAFVGFVLGAIVLGGCVPPRHDASANQRSAIHPCGSTVWVLVDCARDATPPQVTFCYRFEKNGNVGVYLWRCPRTKGSL